MQVAGQLRLAEVVDPVWELVQIEKGAEVVPPLQLFQAVITAGTTPPATAPILALDATSSASGSAADLLQRRGAAGRRGRRGGPLGLGGAAAGEGGGWSALTAGEVGAAEKAAALWGMYAKDS